jgi:septal ring factor EnvC (AmiA/AmiB activator)
MRDTPVSYGRAFPALGFDPAPGSPATLAAQAREADLAARSLTGAAAAAARLDTVEACRDELSDLARDLRHAASAHRALARALRAYAEDLGGLQRRADELERRAAGLRAAPAQLAGVLADAARLRADHRALAAVAAVRIRAAADPPYGEPGRLDLVGGRLDDEPGLPVR